MPSAMMGYLTNPPLITLAPPDTANTAFAVRLNISVFSVLLICGWPKMNWIDAQLVSTDVIDLSSDRRFG